MTETVQTQAHGLQDISETVRQLRCGPCWALSGRDCTPGRMHLARYASARSCGLITEAEMAAVLGSLPGAFTPTTLVPDSAPVSGQLTPRGAEVLSRALADALAYRKERANGYCAACEREYGGPCYDHAGDEDAANSYEALARELMQETGQ